MKKRAITRSSGNVYADLGFPDADEMSIKADLVIAITKAIQARGFQNQTAVAHELGIDQPKVSKLLRGHFREYSVERLMSFLAQLGHDVDILVRKRKPRPGHVHVVAA
jgi:predicted XRE-type DNA-binding protein